MTAGEIGAVGGTDRAAHLSFVVRIESQEVVVSSDTPQWSKDGDDWTVTVGGTVYIASLAPGLWGRVEFYVRTLDGQSFMNHGGDWKSLENALSAIITHEAGKQ